MASSLAHLVLSPNHFSPTPPAEGICPVHHQSGATPCPKILANRLELFVSHLFPPTKRHMYAIGLIQYYEHVIYIPQHPDRVQETVLISYSPVVGLVQ